MKQEKFKTRLFWYFVGMFFISLGTVVSVRSDLGISPVSAVPYTMTCVWGIELGMATIIFHTVMVLLQAVLLRRNFKMTHFLQVGVGIIFGYYTTFNYWLVMALPIPSHPVIQVILSLLGTFLIALGLFFYVPANFIAIPADAFTNTVAQITGSQFSKIKIVYDVTLVSVSLLTCLLMIHRLGSVGIGTIIAAVLVGYNLGLLNKAFGGWRDRLLGVNGVEEFEELMCDELAE